MEWFNVDVGSELEIKEDMLWSCLQHWTGNGKQQQQTDVSTLKLSLEPFSGVFPSPDSCSAIVVAIYLFLLVCFVTILLFLVKDALIMVMGFFCSLILYYLLPDGDDSDDGYASR